MKSIKREVREILKNFKNNLDNNFAGDGQCLERQDTYFDLALSQILELTNPYPNCVKNCEIVKELGVGECENVCPEKFKTTLPKDFCDVCWTSSWAPCTKDTPNAQAVKDKDEWVLCQTCEADRRIKELKGILGTWHTVFETTQLTHAKDRLDVAERELEKLKRRIPLDEKEVENKLDEAIEKYKYNIHGSEFDFHVKHTPHKIHHKEMEVAKLSLRRSIIDIFKECSHFSKPVIKYPEKKGLLPNPKSYVDEMFNREMEQYNSAIDDMRRLNGEGI